MKKETYRKTGKYIGAVSNLLVKATNAERTKLEIITIAYRGKPPKLENNFLKNYLNPKKFLNFLCKTRSFLTEIATNQL